MRRKLTLLGFALLATAGTFVLQPRPVAAASNCFCDDAACCNYCCHVGTRIICTERPCSVQ